MRSLAASIDDMRWTDALLVGCAQELTQKEVNKQREAASQAVADANKYLSDTEPWKLRKTDVERMKTVLHVAAQAVSDLQTMLSPFLPHAANKVHAVLGGEAAQGDGAHETDRDGEERFQPWQQPLVQPGEVLGVDAGVHVALAHPDAHVGAAGDPLDVRAEDGAQGEVEQMRRGMVRA